MNTEASVPSQGRAWPVWPWQAWACGIGLLAGGLTVAWLDAHPTVGATMPPAGPTHPVRVVSVNLASDEILLDLAPEKLLAVSALAVDANASNVARQAATVPNRLNADVERILLLEADVVAIGAHSLAVAHQLEEFGVRVVRIAGYDSIDWTRSLIRTLGDTVGEPARAEAMIGAMDRRLAAVVERVNGRPRPVVALYSLSGWTPGQNTITDEIIRLAGGENLAAQLGLRGWKKLSLDQLILSDPDIIILRGGSKNTPANRELIEHPALQQLRAIRNGRVVTLEPRLVTTVSHHLAETVETLARLFHPAAFEEAS